MVRAGEVDGSQILFLRKQVELNSGGSRNVVVGGGPPRQQKKKGGGGGNGSLVPRP